jgi:Protein of unknown function (DUF4242)
MSARYGAHMPRYLVERTFEIALDVPSGRSGSELLRSIVDCNSDRRVTWVVSYVSLDRFKTFCVYDAPSPEAIRRAAHSNGLPVERITEISVLDPYAYHAR